MTEIDLRELTKGKVHMLTGRKRGQDARLLYQLDKLEKDGVVIVIVAPDDLDTVTPSFVQGFLTQTIDAVSPEQIPERLNLDRLPSKIRDDFKVGIERLLLRRSAPRPAYLS